MIAEDLFAANVSIIFGCHTHEEDYYNGGGAAQAVECQSRNIDTITIANAIK
jgi:hypothetical protein